MHESLTRPLALPCGVTLPNRVAKAAMSEQLCDRSHGPSERLIRLYERWGRGGPALLVTGNIMIDRDRLAESGNVAVDDEAVVPALAPWARTASAHGAVLWAQINHPGRQVPRGVQSDPVAPSAVPLRVGRGLFATPRALTEAEIADIVARFARTAALIARAGFGGVQIHAAHGYLATQFLSPLTNRRTDDWGGTPERRRRFLLEVVRAVRRAVGPGFPVGVKLNSADFQRGGTTEEESIDVVRALEREGIDLLEISGGTYESATMFDGPRKQSTVEREAYFLTFAERVRAVSGVPLMLTGGWRSVAAMATAIDAGTIDVVGLARPFAIDPDLARHLLDGAIEQVPRPSPRLGHSGVNGFLQNAWHVEQLHRMADGLEPDPDRGAVRALFRHLLQRGWNPLARSLTA